ncbi:hypothetical protein MMC30_009078 [Trapelia coarctata]|nr:hypothetical protein [Trapelia coarctata]
MLQDSHYQLLLELLIPSSFIGVYPGVFCSLLTAALNKQKGIEPSEQDAKSCEKLRNWLLRNFKSEFPQFAARLTKDIEDEIPDLITKWKQVTTVQDKAKADAELTATLKYLNEPIARIEPETSEL